MARMKEATRHPDDRHDRHERRHHRRRRRSSSSDSEAEESTFPAWKTMAVVGVIGICFAILYPKMFHPMLMFALGYGPQEEPPEARTPPPARGRPQHMPGGPRPGGPPAMPAHTGSSGGNKGVWHTVLPFYTVGVIGFLLYTLSKIMWKKPEKRKKKRSTRYSRVAGTESSASGSDDDQSNPQGKKELKTLQSRLLQTEDAMQKILSQLELLQNASVDEETADKIREDTIETLNSLSKDPDLAKAAKEADKDRRHSDQSDSEQTDSEQQPQPYISDLEKALADFKVLTENYVNASMALKQRQDKQLAEEKNKPKHDEESEEENEASAQTEDKERKIYKSVDVDAVDELTGFDAMEGETDLTVPDATGTIVGGTCPPDEDDTPEHSPIATCLQGKESGDDDEGSSVQCTNNVRKRRSQKKKKSKMAD